MKDKNIDMKFPLGSSTQQSATKENIVFFKTLLQSIADNPSSTGLVAAAGATGYLSTKGAKENESWLGWAGRVTSNAGRLGAQATTSALSYLSSSVRGTAENKSSIIKETIKTPKTLYNLVKGGALSPSNYSKLIRAFSDKEELLRILHDTSFWQAIKEVTDKNPRAVEDLIKTAKASGLFTFLKTQTTSQVNIALIEFIESSNIEETVGTQIIPKLAGIFSKNKNQTLWDKTFENLYNSPLIQERFTLRSSDLNSSENKFTIQELSKLTNHQASFFIKSFILKEHLPETLLFVNNIEAGRPWNIDLPGAPSITIELNESQKLQLKQFFTDLNNPNISNQELNAQLSNMKPETLEEMGKIMLYNDALNSDFASMRVKYNLTLDLNLYPALNSIIEIGHLENEEMTSSLKLMLKILDNDKFDQLIEKLLSQAAPTLASSGVAIDETLITQSVRKAIQEEDQHTIKSLVESMYHFNSYHMSESLYHLKKVISADPAKSSIKGITLQDFLKVNFDLNYDMYSHILGPMGVRKTMLHLFTDIAVHSDITTTAERIMLGKKEEIQAAGEKGVEVDPNFSKEELKQIISSYLEFNQKAQIGQFLRNKQESLAEELSFMIDNNQQMQTSLTSQERDLAKKTLGNDLVFIASILDQHNQLKLVGEKYIALSTAQKDPASNEKKETQELVSSVIDTLLKSDLTQLSQAIKENKDSLTSVIEHRLRTSPSVKHLNLDPAILCEGLANKPTNVLLAVKNFNEDKIFSGLKHLFKAFKFKDFCKTINDNADSLWAKIFPCHKTARIEKLTKEAEKYEGASLTERFEKLYEDKKKKLSSLDKEILLDRDFSDCKITSKTKFSAIVDNIDFSNSTIHTSFKNIEIKNCKFNDVKNVRKTLKALLEAKSLDIATLDNIKSVISKKTEKYNKKGQKKEIAEIEALRMGLEGKFRESAKAEHKTQKFQKSLPILESAIMRKSSSWRQKLEEERNNRGIQSAQPKGPQRRG